MAESPKAKSFADILQQNQEFVVHLQALQDDMGAQLAEREKELSVIKRQLDEKQQELDELQNAQLQWAMDRQALLEQHDALKKGHLDLQQSHERAQLELGRVKDDLGRAKARDDQHAVDRQALLDQHESLKQGHLDLQQSRKEHPNENWARELMELFTIGIGNYTEQDIRESARAFTGYRIDMTNQQFRFAPKQHDDGPKTFMGKTGPWNGDDIIDTLMKQPACAQVQQADQRERPPEPGAALVRVDPNDVNLPDRFVGAAACLVGVAARLVVVGSRVVGVAARFVAVCFVIAGGCLVIMAVDFGPVKPDDLPCALGQEETCRIEPGLTLPQVEVCPRPCSLLRMLGER